MWGIGMRMLRTRTFVVAAGLAGSALVPVVAAPAAHAGCPTDTYYSVSGKTTRLPFRGVPTFKDGRGGTITVSRNYSGSVSYRVEVGAESEVGAILAKAKISIKASLERTNSTSTTHTYSHKISKGRFGHVRYVSWGKRVTWTKYRDNATCTTTKLASGVISFPSVEEGWYYWETRS
jgi:hypothetical protein